MENLSEAEAEMLSSATNLHGHLKIQLAGKRKYLWNAILKIYQMTTIVGVKAAPLSLLGMNVMFVKW